jgi:hypothetical protein
MPNDGTPATPPLEWRDLTGKAFTELDPKKLTNRVKLRILLADDHEIVRRG